MPWSLGTFNISKVLLGIFSKIPNLLGHKLGDKSGDDRTNSAFNAFDNPLELVLITPFNDNNIL